MRIKMTSYMTGKNFEYRPGDIVELDEHEATRIISVGGAVPVGGKELVEEVSEEVEEVSEKVEEVLEPRIEKSSRVRGGR